VALFPLFVELAGRPCLVVGGGAVAERKIQSLLYAGARVTVVSPTLTPALAALAATRRVVHVARDYAPGDLRGAVLAFAATDDGAVNGAVAREGRRRGVWVNAADDPVHCDAILPALVRRGPVTVAISTGGASPALARATRERIDAALPPAYGVLGSIAADARRALRARGRRASAEAWAEALRDALRALRAGRSRRQTARRLQARLERACG
jgi:siroheme synthase-like protein